MKLNLALNLTALMSMIANTRLLLSLHTITCTCILSSNTLWKFTMYVRDVLLKLLTVYKLKVKGTPNYASIKICARKLGCVSSEIPGYNLIIS